MSAAVIQLTLRGLTDEDTRHEKNRPVQIPDMDVEMYYERLKVTLNVTCPFTMFCI
jgi:hypothetical protein